jgi:hypothetical protein
MLLGEFDFSGNFPLGSFPFDRYYDPPYLALVTRSFDQGFSNS